MRFLKAISRKRPERRHARTSPKYIVSDDLRFVYFVIPKVACTSIKAALLPLFDIGGAAHETTREDGTPRNLRVHKLFRESPFQIDKPTFVARSDTQYRDHFKFAFVRNPWDRLVSCYFSKLAPDRGGLDLPDDVQDELYPGMPFAAFVEAVCAIPDDRANAHFRSQHTVVCSDSSDRAILADFIGRFETLGADFESVAKRIAGPRALRLEHKARSTNRTSRSYTDHYDDRLKDLVHKRYQDDIEIFGYSYR